MTTMARAAEAETLTPTGHKILNTTALPSDAPKNVDVFIATAILLRGGAWMGNALHSLIAIHNKGDKAGTDIEVDWHLQAPVPVRDRGKILYVRLLEKHNIIPDAVRKTLAQMIPNLVCVETYASGAYMHVGTPGHYNPHNGQFVQPQPERIPFARWAVEFWLNLQEAQKSPQQRAAESSAAIAKLDIGGLPLGPLAGGLEKSRLR